MNIVVNGETINHTARTVDDLIRQMGYEPKFVAVAINYECIRRADFTVRQIAEGDEIEILSPQSGG